MNESREKILYYRDASIFEEDSEEVNSYFDYILKGQGFDILRAGDLENVEEMLEREDIKLLLFYLGSDSHPEEAIKASMLSVLSCMRTVTTKPIMVLYGGVEERLMLKAFQSGADEFIDKRVTLMELVARIKNQIVTYNRLVHLGEDIIISISGLEINDTAKTVTVEGHRVDLTPTEYKILMLLIAKKGKVLSNKQIYEAIWQMEPVGVDNTIAVHIRHLREKIEKNPKKPQWVRVVWGQGYRVG